MFLLSKENTDLSTPLLFFFQAWNRKNSQMFGEERVKFRTTQTVCQNDVNHFMRGNSSIFFQWVASLMQLCNSAFPHWRYNAFSLFLFGNDFCVTLVRMLRKKPSSFHQEENSGWSRPMKKFSIHSVQRGNTIFVFGHKSEVKQLQ